MTFFLNTAKLTVTLLRDAPEDLEISTKPDLAQVETKDLIRFYNRAIPSSPVKKFASRAAAVLRVFPLLERMAMEEPIKEEDKSPWNLGESEELPRPAPAAAEDTPTEIQEDDVATATKKKKGTKKSATKGKAKRGGLAGAMLRRVGTENPCRDGGIRAKSWDMIGGGMKYETYVEKGGNLPALAFNIKTGRVKVEKAAAKAD